MHTIARALAAAAFLALAFASTSGHADPFADPFQKGMTGCDSVVTYNLTKKWIWVTIYDLAKTQHLDYGWVAPNNSRAWQSGRYSCLAYYYVRAEVKNNESDHPVDGPNIFDTTVQLPRGSGNHVISLESDWIQLREPGSHVVRLLERNKHFAWIFETPLDSHSAANAPTFDAPILTIANGSGQAMFVSPIVGVNPLANVRCIPPGGQTSYEEDDIGPLPFSVMGPFATCAQRTDLGRATIIPWTMDWGVHRVVLRLGLVVYGAPVPGMNQYSFKNTTPAPVKFMVDGAPAGQAPCVPAGASSPVLQLPLKAAPGVHNVTAYTVSRCGDPNDAGAKLATDGVLILPGFKANYALRWGFFPN
jgi:hypothetical protein